MGDQQTNSGYGEQNRRQAHETYCSRHTAPC
jgi:hypothetical protein